MPLVKKPAKLFCVIIGAIDTAGNTQVALPQMRAISRESTLRWLRVLALRYVLHRWSDGHQAILCVSIKVVKSTENILGADSANARTVVTENKVESLHGGQLIPS